MMKIETIEDVVARETWTYRAKDGAIRSSEILVGRPMRVPNGEDWVCPVLIEHFTSHIVPAYGVGPVDALLNAMILVRTFWETCKDSLEDLQ